MTLPQTATPWRDFIKPQVDRRWLLHSRMAGLLLVPAATLALLSSPAMDHLYGLLCLAAVGLPSPLLFAAAFVFPTTVRSDEPFPWIRVVIGAVALIPSALIYWLLALIAAEFSGFHVPEWCLIPFAWMIEE